VISPLAPQRLEQRLQQTWQRLAAQGPALEAEVLSVLATRLPPARALRRSIAGIGRQTAGLRRLVAGEFTRVDRYRPLLAQAGLSPGAYPCATRVGGKGRLPKLGGALLGGNRFLCRLAARTCHAACKALSDRLVANGKNGKRALMAVCTKRLPQAFARVQSGLPYQADFSAKLALYP